ncbi:MAG: zf-HC2 domain-containing protein [Rhodospirillales bacterium]
MDEVLRLAAGCRPAEDLVAYHEGTLAGRRREELRAHLDGCASCCAAMEFLAGTEEADAVPLPADVEQRLEDLMAAAMPAAASAKPGASTPWLRLAAGLLVASFLVVSGWLWLAPGGPGQETGALRSEDRLVALSPAGRITAVPERFTWSPRPQAVDYVVVLLDEDLEEIWTGATAAAGTSLELDAEARRRLAAGGRFSWQVIARNRRGAAFDESPVTHFEIAGATPTP